MTIARPARCGLGGVALLLAWTSVACGGGSAERPVSDPSRSPTVTRSVTATVPTPTRSVDRSERPSPSPSEPEPTRAPSPSPTRTPTPEPTPTGETQAQSPVSTGSPQQTPSPTPVSEDVQTEESGLPGWAWWLLGLLVLALAIGVPVLLRSRRRTAWRESLAAAEAEVTWFARELVPELRGSPSQERLAGGWAVASPRIVGLEDRLTSLEATAPDQPGRERALALREAVRGGRQRLNTLAAGAAAPELALDLDEVAADLESALRGLAPQVR